jgi:hypothetical protein
MCGSKACAKLDARVRRSRMSAWIFIAVAVLLLSCSTAADDNLLRLHCAHETFKA